MMRSLLEGTKAPSFAAVLPWSMTSVGIAAFSNRKKYSLNTLRKLELRRQAAATTALALLGLPMLVGCLRPFKPKYLTRFTFGARRKQARGEVNKEPVAAPIATNYPKGENL